MKQASGGRIVIETDGESADSGLDPNVPDAGGYDQARAAPALVPGNYVVREELPLSSMTGSYYDLKNLPDIPPPIGEAEVQTMLTLLTDVKIRLGNTQTQNAEESVTVNASIALLSEGLASSTDEVKSQISSSLASSTDEIKMQLEDNRVSNQLSILGMQQGLEGLTEETNAKLATLTSNLETRAAISESKQQLNIDAIGFLEAELLSSRISLEEKSDLTKQSIDSFRVAFDGRDLATQQTLSAFKTEAKASADGIASAIGEPISPDPETVIGRLNQVKLQLVANADAGNSNTATLVSTQQQVRDALIAVSEQNKADLTTEMTTNKDALVSTLTQHKIDLLAGVDESKVAIVDRLTQNKDALIDQSVSSTSTLRAAIEEFAQKFDDRDLATELTLALINSKIDIPMSQHSKAGRVFIAGCFHLDVGGFAANKFPGLTLRNPVGSGKDIYLRCLTLTSSIDQWFRVYRVDVTGGTPAQIDSSNPDSGASSVVVAETHLTPPPESSAMPGRVVVDGTIGFVETTLEPMILAPGQAITVKAVVGGTEHSSSIQIKYLELPR